MTAESPLVSIVMPAYNRAHTIGQSLDSCLAQTHTQLEVIVVDDGSQDATADVVRGYAERDGRVRLISQPNGGPAVARNTGIHASNGAYVQFCDSDDVLLPEKIARSLATLLEARQHNERVALAYCRMRHVADDGHTPLDIPPLPILRHDNTFCELLHSNGSPIQTSTMLALKEALLAIGGYRAEATPPAEDWDMLLRFSEHYDFVPHDETLVLYRHTTQALTRHALKMARARLNTLRDADAYPSRRECLPDEAYAALLAGRYHVLGMVYWREGRGSEAREAFQHAITLTPEGRRSRRWLQALTYIVPARWAERYFLR